MHDRYRKDAGGQDTFARIMHSVQLLEQYQVDYNVVTVVTNDTAKQASFLYKFWKRNHYPFVQFIPCMDEIKRQKTAETPAETAPVETAADNASEGSFFLRLWHRLLALFGL